MLQISSTKITGTLGALGWVQAYDFDSDSKEKKETRGHLFVLISVRGLDGGLEGAFNGRQLVSRLQEKYFGDVNEKPFNALKSAVDEVLSEFRNFFEKIEIVACSVVDNIVYSVVGGDGEVAIYRSGIIAPILVGQSNEVIVASGFPKLNDCLVLGTRKFFEEVGENKIKNILENKDIESITQDLAQLVRGSVFSENMGVIIIKFSESALLESYSSEENFVATKRTIKFFKNAFYLSPKISKSFENLFKKIPERGIYVRQGLDNDAFSKSKKLSFTVAVILLCLLGVSIGFGIRQNKINKVKASFMGKLVDANNYLDQAISISSVDINKSRELFRKSRDLYNQIFSLQVSDPKINELGQKIQIQKGPILGEYNQEPSLFWDLSLLSSNFNGDRISGSGGNVYVLDKNGKRIAEVEISTKKSSIVASPDKMVDPKEITSYTDRVFVLDSDGVYEVDKTRQKVVDKTWTGDAIVAAYTGNLYLLDKDANSIYRFAGNGGTFGSRQSWLSTDTNPNFSNALSWAIDGSIYVLFPNAKILKFSLGSSQDFSISGINLTSVDAIFASDDTTGVYLLDRAGKRVVVLDKNGVYKAQYASDQIANATGFVVSETEKKIILLSGEKLLSLDIKHL